MILKCLENDGSKVTYFMYTAQVMQKECPG